MDNVKLLSVDKAVQQLLAVITPVDSENILLSEALWRVLAEPVMAITDLPPFSNSSMDGFAVRVSDVRRASVQNPINLDVVADIPAGQISDIVIQPGQAARIMTGAVIPGGAEAVVPVEDTNFDMREPGVLAPANIQIFRSVTLGENVRSQGQDITRGDTVLAPQCHLRPQEIGFLAMLGVVKVDVYKKPRVAIISTGDELIRAGSPPEPGKIYDSNSYTLSALVMKYGCEPVDLGVVRDQVKAVRKILDRAISERVDIIISSAGVSVGAFDFVRSVVEEYGRLEFWRVNMRPGKPLVVGMYRNVPFIGLPGNPVSAFVGFEVFVRPALLKMAGMPNWDHVRRRVTLSEPIESDGRESYLRAIVEYQGRSLVARLTGHQGSGNLHSLVQANALLIVPSEVKSLPIGSELDAWLLGGEAGNL